MVKKYFIFDRFDFLCRFFSRFFYNEFSFGRTKFTRSSSDKPVQMPCNLSVISNEREGLSTTSMYVSTLPLICFIQFHFVTMVRNIDQHILATLLTFSCSISIAYNWMWPILPMQPAPHKVFPP